MKWVVKRLKSRLRTNHFGVPVRNFGCVAPDRIYRGARPGQDDYESLRRLGIETVVTVRDGDTRDDGIAARAAGMRWYTLPLSDRELPSFERVKTFLAWAASPQLLPIFLHGDSGIHRTGGLVAAYRIAVDGWDNARAYDEAVSFGFYSGRGHDPWEYFIKTVSPAELAIDEPAGA